MNKHIIISGPTGSGKTSLAKGLIGKAETVYLSQRDIDARYKFQEVKLSTEVICLDEVTNISWLAYLMSQETILIERPADRTLEMNTPRIIAMTSEEYLPYAQAGSVSVIRLAIDNG